MRILTLLLILFPVLAPTQRPSAIEQFQDIQSHLKAASATKNWQSNLTAARSQAQLLNQSPLSLLELARAEARTGDLSSASEDLDRFVRMGASTDLIETSPVFAEFRQSQRFASIQSALQRNRRTISLGSAAFSLPDSQLLAEDLDFDLDSNRFFITSVGERKIISSDLHGDLRDFAKSPDGWPLLAVKVDSAHGRLWATEVALQGFASVPEKDWGRSAILCYELEDGKLLKRVEGPRPSSLGDMVLTKGGDVIVSDGDGGAIYRLSRLDERLTRIDAGDFISPQTPALHPDGRHLFVPDYLRGIGVLNLDTKKVQWLSMQGRFSLSGIDGLYFHRGRLIAVQNGTTPERLVSFSLDASLTRIVSQSIIEQSIEALDPTHGVLVDGDFFYLVNAGWHSIDDQGRLNPGAKPSPPRMMQMPL
jgi:hypothetical protein